MKNQRLLTIILILTLAISLCLLTGCGCDHTTTAWYNTDTTHKLVCADCGVGLEESQSHEWEADGINCTTCDIGKGYTTGLEYELSSNEAYFTLVGPGTFWGEKLNIAPLYFGIPVQKVGPSAFCNEHKLEPGVDAINEVIEEITIPASITYIGEMAFDWIDHLTKVTFAPDSQLETIGRLAFAFNYNLTEITIPASVIDVKENAFQGSQALTIKYEGSSTSNWNKNWNTDNNPVVLNCTTNQKANDGRIYFMQDGVRYAISGGSAMVVRQPENAVQIYIPATVTYNNNPYQITSVVPGAFSERAAADLVYHRKEVVFDANCKVTVIGKDTFLNCIELEKVVLPNSVTTLGQESFRHCWKLKDFVIPSNVKTIEDYAFWACLEFTEITIPASVTQLGMGIFFNCSSLEKVIFANPTGWSVETISPVDGSFVHEDLSASNLSNPQTAADYLLNTYMSYDWSRS